MKKLLIILAGFIAFHCGSDISTPINPTVGPPDVVIESTAKGDADSEIAPIFMPEEIVPPTDNDITDPYEDYRCDDHKVVICHNNNSICVADEALEAHFKLGVYVGECLVEDDNDFTEDDPFEAYRCKVKKVFVCHKNGKTLCVGDHAAEAHLNNGGYLGFCGD